MTLMSNLTMDLTGLNPNYTEENKIFRISKVNQLIDFETTIHRSSLKVKLISGGVNDVDLHYLSDFTIPTSFISSCDNDLSAAKILDPTFSGDFISGIQMTRSIQSGEYYTISVSYQRLYPNQLRTQYYHNEPLEITPEVMYDLIRSVTELKLLNSRVMDPSDYSNQTLFLEPDPTETNENNIITNEEHLVNVANNRYVIHPKGGSYYADSLQVHYINPDTQEATLLIRDTDYYILGMDEAKTKATYSTSPVYKYILIASNLSGTIKITYHAYGGEPTLDNYESINNSLNNVIQYLRNSSTITEDNLGGTEIITSLFERVNLLEERVRRLYNTPRYGDVTFGKAIRMQVIGTNAVNTTNTDPLLHWYTIAELYKINTDDGAALATADTFTFRVQTLSHLQFTAAVSVDISNHPGDIMNVNVISENYPRGFIPFTSYPEVDAQGRDLISRPQLRVIWNEPVSQSSSDEQFSGIYLQIGLELKTITSETLVIEDLSGHESCWKLINEPTEAVNPSDFDVYLPNGTSIWAPNNSQSRQESMLIPFKKGTLIWHSENGVRMNAVDGWDVLILPNDTVNRTYLADNTNIDKFTKLRVGIEEYSGLQFPVDIPFSGSNHLKGHASFTYQNQPVYINAEIYRETVRDAYANSTVSRIFVRLNYDVTYGSDSNPLYIKHLIIF